MNRINENAFFFGFSTDLKPIRIILEGIMRTAETKFNLDLEFLAEFWPGLNFFRGPQGAKNLRYEDRV